MPYACRSHSQDRAGAPLLEPDSLEPLGRLPLGSLSFRNLPAAPLLAPSTAEACVLSWLGAVGAASGAILGDAGTGAGLGAIGGAARSAQIGDREKTRVVHNCLRGRGYRVLN